MAFGDHAYKLLRWLLGGIFIYAGSTKLMEPQVFAVLIEAYGIVPEGLIIPVAIVLPVLEVVAGVGLLFDIRGSLALIAGLLVLFMAVLAYGIWLGLDVDCGCFGPEDPEAKAFHGLRSSLYRDLVMMAGVFLIYAWRRYRAIRPAGAMAVVNHLVSKRRNVDAHAQDDGENAVVRLSGGSDGRSGRCISGRQI